MYSAILFPVEKQLFDKQLIPWLTIRPIFYFSNSIMENKFPSTAPMQNQPPMPYVRRFTACPNLTIMGHNAIMQKHYHAEYSLSKAKKVFNPSEKHRMFRKIRCEFVCLRFLAPPPNECLVFFSFSGQKLLIFFVSHQSSCCLLASTMSDKRTRTPVAPICNSAEILRLCDQLVR